jgi:hypothetical protein
MGARRPSPRRASLGLLGLFLALALALALAARAEARTAARCAGHGAAALTFTLDPSWPKGLPNNWVFGGADSIWVDRHDHVWVLSRPLSVPASELAAGKIAAPPVLELDHDGNFIRGWGGPTWVQPWFANDITLDYPVGTPPEHGIYVDDQDHVWLTGGGNVVMKFTRAGRLLLTIGQFGKTGGSNDPTTLGNPTDMAVDTKRHEVFVADGYVNRRVIVFDSETGAFKRYWGAYGNRPDDSPPALYQPGQPLPTQFFIVHGIQLSRDGLLYVSDRQRDRVQVFREDGTFVREQVVDPEAPAGGGITVQGPFTRPDVAAAGFGSVARVAFSADAKQRFLYVASIRGRVFVLRRGDLKVLGSFAAAGLHHIATDREGNLYISDGRTPLRYLAQGTGSYGVTATAR